MNVRGPVLAACIFCLPGTPPSDEEFTSFTAPLQAESQAVEVQEEIGNGSYSNEREIKLMVENLRLKQELQHLKRLVSQLRSKLATLESRD